MADPVSGTVNKVESLLKENVDVAISILIGAVAYAVLDPFVSPYLDPFVPSEFQPAVVGVGVIALGVALNQKMIAGAGAGMILYNAVKLVVPLAEDLGQKARNVVPS